MAERGRAARGDRGAERAAARGDLEAGEAAAGGGQGAGRAGAVRGQLVHGAAAGGGAHGPHPHGHAGSLGDGNKKIWLKGNRNKDVDGQKILPMGSPFRSENTPTKLKNKKLQAIIDELRVLKDLVSHGTSETCEESSKRYKELLEEFEKTKDEIRSSHGMAIPMPKDLEKPQKFKMALFK